MIIRPSSSAPASRGPMAPGWAFYVGLNVEAFRDRQAIDRHLERHVHLKPDPLNHGCARLRRRVGIWRLIDTFDRFGMRASVLLNSDVCLSIRKSSKRDDGASGMARARKKNSILHADMTPTEERRFLTDVVETIAEANRWTPACWMGQA